jgi:hypothetical protein
MRKAFSIIVHIVSWIGMAFALILTAFWVALLVHARANGGAIDGFGALGFMIYAEFFCPGLFVFGFIPSGILFFYKRQRRDVFSFCMAAISFAAMLGEAVVVYYMPHTGAC